MTSKINRILPLIMVNMSVKVDEEAHNGLVTIVFTSLLWYMSIVTLAFDFWPPRSRIRCDALTDWLTDGRTDGSTTTLLYPLRNALRSDNYASTLPQETKSSNYPPFYCQIIYICLSLYETYLCPILWKRSGEHVKLEKRLYLRL